MPLVYEADIPLSPVGNDVTDAAGLLQGLRGTADMLAAQPGMLGSLGPLFGEEDYPANEAPGEPNESERCSRQNGLGWQCSNNAVLNRRYCEKHLQRKSKKQRAKEAPMEEAPPPNDGKVRPPPGMCRRTNGQGWWCKRESVPGTTFCQNHLVSIRKQRESRYARDSPAKPESPALETFSEQGGVSDSDEDRPLWELPGLRSAASPLLEAAEAGEKVREDTRCKRRDGRNWQCSKARLMGRPYCKEHTESDKKKREAAKRSESERKRRRKEKEERAQEAEQAQQLQHQRQVAADLLMSAVETLMPPTFPEQLIRFAPAGLQAAGMPLTNRSAFTPVASHGSAFTPIVSHESAFTPVANHESAFTPVAGHSFGGHAFVPVNRLGNKGALQPQSGFTLYSEGQLGGASLREEILSNLAYPAADLAQVETLQKKVSVLQQAVLEQQALVEQQERERKAYEENELLMQGFELPASLYSGDTQRYGSILTL